MYTTKQIIDNQRVFKEEIINFFLKENKSIVKDVKDIKTEDEFILKEKEKIIERLKKNNIDQLIKKYFFENSQRDQDNYAWWDVHSQEARILQYVKK